MLSSEAALERLKLILCPTKNVSHQDQKTLDQVYQFWLLSWKVAYQNLGQNPEQLTSDAFTRADFTGSLFHEGSCVTTVLIRWLHPSEPPYPEDSYFFRAWKKHFDKFRQFDKIMICSHMCFAPTLKQLSVIPSVRDAMVYTHMRVFLESGADRLLATPRVDRKVDSLLYSWHAQPIEKEVESGYGDTMALTFFRREDALLSLRERETKDLLQLWNHRQVITPEMETFEFLQDKTKRTPYKKAG